MDEAMNRARLSPSLLAEVYDLEEDAYRLCLREARRMDGGPPAAALRAVVAHANEALEELPRLAHERHARLGSIGALALDTLRRLGDVFVDKIVDHEHAYRRALTALRKGIDLVHLVQAAATEEGDDALATWCHRWLEAREKLVAEAAMELEWFGRHPNFSRLFAFTRPAT
jgi:hypothetical protein